MPDLVGPPSAEVDVSIVVPTFNERRNLGEVVDRLDRVLARRVASHEIVVVDDDSPDGTFDEAVELAGEHPSLRPVRRVGPRGLGSAVVCGWARSSGRVVGVIDADLQHPPETVVALLDAVDDGADLACASRYVRDGDTAGWPLIRRTISLAARLTTRAILPGAPRLADPMSGYFVVRRAVVEGVALTPVGYKILLEVLHRGAPTEVREVAYRFGRRRHGASKATPMRYVELVRHLCALRTSPQPVPALPPHVDVSRGAAPVRSTPAPARDIVTLPRPT
ncbi:MAG: polyprenol monophosphomannose synthase [Actinomycetota bacterium]|nr:polyprenol monophosphomannose synthase [Actinomycetota bacterium]